MKNVTSDNQHSNKSGDTIADNENIVIKQVSDSNIEIHVNGETQQLSRKLDEVLLELNRMQASSIQIADKIYNIDSIGEANFEVLLGQLAHEQKLPEGIAEFHEDMGYAKRQIH